MKRTGPTNPVLQTVIQELKKGSSVNQVDLWKRVADDLESPTRKRRVVNVSRIARCTQPNEVVVVPGKVLGSGMLSHSVTVAAFAFSSAAAQQIRAAKGKCLSIPELLKQNPKGANVRIIG